MSVNDVAKSDAPEVAALSLNFAIVTASGLFPPLLSGFPALLGVLTASLHEPGISTMLTRSPI
jgi:hypothetical protein